MMWSLFPAFYRSTERAAELAPASQPGLRLTPTEVEALALANRCADAGRAAHVLARICHSQSKNAGWWTGVVDPKVDAHLVPAKLMLIVSEISEAMEGHRKGAKDDKLPTRPAIEVELADALIRIGDLAGALGLDLGGAVREKLAYNAHRADHKPEARAAAGGKAY